MKHCRQAAIYARGHHQVSGAPVWNSCSPARRVGVNWKQIFLISLEIQKIWNVFFPIPSYNINCFCSSILFLQKGTACNPLSLKGYLLECEMHQKGSLSILNPNIMLPYYHNGLKLRGIPHNVTSALLHFHPTQTCAGHSCHLGERKNPFLEWDKCFHRMLILCIVSCSGASLGHERQSRNQ